MKDDDSGRDLLAVGLPPVNALVVCLFYYPDGHRAVRFCGTISPNRLSIADPIEAATRHLVLSCATVVIAKRVEHQIRPFIAFNRSADPWCNTLLFEVTSFQHQLNTMPAGIGLSLIYYLDYLRSPVRSKYMLVGPSVQRLLEARVPVRYHEQTRLSTNWI
jgi:hypothetical protein